MRGFLFLVVSIEYRVLRHEYSYQVPGITYYDRLRYSISHIAYRILIKPQASGLKPQAFNLNLG